MRFLVVLSFFLLLAFFSGSSLKPNFSLDPNCSRKEFYSNPSEFNRVLNYIKEREENSAKSPAYKYAPFPLIPTSILNCLSVEYINSREGLGAEGYFVFDPIKANSNYLPIYVDNSYKNTDELLSSLLVVHELTHALQFVNKSELSCIEKEVEAFYMQYIFFLHKSKDQDLDKYNDFIKSSNYRKHPQIQIMNSILYWNTAEAERLCPYGSTQNTNKCLDEVTKRQIREMVSGSDFYKRQCGSS